MKRERQTMRNEYVLQIIPVLIFSMCKEYPLRFFPGFSYMTIGMRWLWWAVIFKIRLKHGQH